MLREMEHLCFDVGNDLRAVFGLAMLDGMLGDVVTILIRDELVALFVELLHDPALGLQIAALKHALDYTAAIRMPGELTDLTVKRIDDELDMFRRNALDGLLDDMVAILVFDTANDASIELLDQTGLLVGKDMFKSLLRLAWIMFKDAAGTYLLHNSAAIHLSAESEDMPLHAVGQDLLLVLVSMLKELLDHVIAEDVGHQLHRILLDLAEDSVLLLAFSRLQLLLNET